MSMAVIVLISGIALFLMGAALRYMINRRRFYRRGIGGLQHYDNYEKAVATTCLERIGKIIAFLLMLIGLLLVASYFMDKKMVEEIKKEKRIGG